MKTIKLLTLFVAISLTFSACSDDHEHEHGTEEELITTVIYTLTDGNTTTTLQWEDLDGDSGDDPIITNGTLSAGTTYTGTIQLLNRTETPAEDITVEVKTEGDEHEFFYTPTGAIASITKSDEDANGNPLGIESTLTTGTTGSGTITIVLKHEPTKPNNGNAANAGGSTDVEVSFNVTVQ